MIVLVTQAQIPTPSHPLGAHFLTIPAFKPRVDKIFLGASTEVPGHFIIFFFLWGGGGGGGEEGGELLNM